MTENIEPSDVPSKVTEPPEAVKILPSVTVATDEVSKPAVVPPQLQEPDGDMVMADAELENSGIDARETSEVTAEAEKKIVAESGAQNHTEDVGSQLNNEKPQNGVSLPVVTASVDDKAGNGSAAPPGNTEPIQKVARNTDEVSRATANGESTEIYSGSQLEAPEPQTEVIAANAEPETEVKMDTETEQSVAESVGIPSTSSSENPEFPSDLATFAPPSADFAPLTSSSGTDTKRKRSDSLAGSPASVRVKTEPSATDRPVIVPPRPPQLDYTPLKTGICYDVRMRYHAKIVTSYFEYIDPHPEDPRRIYRIYKILAEAGLLNDPCLIGQDDIGDLMAKIPVREATDEEILLVHSEAHLKFIASTTTMTKQQLLEETEKGDSVYFNHESFLAAKLSCGGTIEAAKAVVEGRVKNSIAVVRPPGHHAEPDTPGGFCLFSNVAVGASYLLKNFPESVRRIVILDWDIHHGNGTQKCFYSDPRVLYISLHRYEGGKFYPGTPFGGADKVGEGAGRGYSVNIPWPGPGMGDAEYLYAFQKVIMPICREFSPDFVFISSGFDAAAGDVLGGCHVTPQCYGQMTHEMKSLANGNLCVVLEGGYNLDSIANSALSVTRVLIGEAPQEIQHTIPKPEAVETIEEVVRQQAPFWRCMRPGYFGLEAFFGTSHEVLAESSVRVQDALRTYQSRLLQAEFNLIPLPVLGQQEGEPLSPSLEDQVLVSPGVFDASVVVVVVHDPSEMWARPDVVTGLLDTPTALTVDSSQRFVQWARRNKYGYMDVNVPSALTGPEDDGYNAGLAAQELLLYVWDNYLQYYPIQKLVFIGLGEAYGGVVHLLGHRDLRDVCRAVISFVGKAPLRPVVPLIDESVTDWFYRNSLVFTGARHACWGDNDGVTSSSDMKRPRRKFGRVLRCDSEGLDNNVKERFTEAIEFIDESLEDESSDSS